MNTGTPKRNVETEFSEVDAKEAWPLLFQHIRSECLNYDYTFSEARKSENKNLNRYRDVSPFDHSRVVLSKGTCDYINANLVKMDRTHRRYILTQGPLPQTVGHFWVMVWEQNCKAVLMLNRVIEKNQIKCHQYWPLGSEGGPDSEDVMLFTDVGLKVQYISHTKASYYTTRILRLTEIESGTTRDILHFHYTHWPDFGVPQSPTAFLHFLMVVRQSGALDQNVGPPVVHCSAGIGRSGTFCLVDSCLVLIEENGLESVNVRDVLLEMRRFRMGLIQTPDQLRFSYQAIIEGAKKLSNNLNNVNGESIDLLNHIELEETIPEVDPDEPPPLPPPRGESLVRSCKMDNNHVSADSSPEGESPPDTPLPFAPSQNQTELSNSHTWRSPSDSPPDRPLPSPPSEMSPTKPTPRSPPLTRPMPVEPVTSSDDGSFKTSSPPSSPESTSKNEREEGNGIRQRKQARVARQDRIEQQIREMKRKQQAAESRQTFKRSSKKQKLNEERQRK